MFRNSFVWVAAVLLIWGALLAQQPTAKSALAQEGLEVLAGLLRIDTSNPPGNELAAALYLGDILGRERIPYEIFEPVAGRATLVATLKGSGQRPPLILLQHLDVVPPFDGEDDPFSGEVRNGAIWGRGALDMKGLGIVHLMSFLKLKRSDRALSRDVVLIASADEETGSRLGVSWLLDNYADRFRDAGLVLTEGGSNLQVAGGLAYVGIEVAQKVPLWLRLSVRGPGGHAALAASDSPVVRLVRALSRLEDFSPSLQVDSSVERFFRRVARFQPAEMRPLFQDIRSTLADPEFDPALLGPYYRSLLQNTVNPTVIRAGDSVNSIPAEAWADLDCRLLPGVNPRDFVRELAKLIGDPAVSIEPLLEARPGRSSPEKTELVRAAAESLEELGLDAEVGPSVTPGFTDSRFFRERGIPAYGISPFRHVSEYGRGIHGANERLSVEDFDFGLEFFSRMVDRLVYPPMERALPATTSGR